MLSDNIRYYRKRKEMSQDELAEQLGVSRQSISLWETGQTQPTIDNIIALTRLFGITSDELLSDDPAAPSADAAEPLPEPPADTPDAAVPAEGQTDRKRHKALPLVAVLAVCAVLVAGTVVFLLGRARAGRGEPDGPADSAMVPARSDRAESTKGANPTKTAAAKATAGKTTAKTTKAAAKTTKAAAPATTQAAAVDLFAYCRDLAVKIGRLNGDYTIYQQPATRYGGYDNEYFSLSYWGDSNMVEFCLHCPLDETYSVNFYLRMRGGYRQKYEYLSSRYYRDTGESVRSASGTIDPAVFTDRYPLNCDEYKGSTQGQDDFMEESRVGLCDLIRCLKGFVEEEGLDIDFSAFGFVNF